jgi:tRNA U34 5-methylaminomethyl-2-thiouridine-forming methyltransferase MnmC
MTQKIEQANPSWIDDNIPRSDRFSDTYYSKNDGQGETDHVFISGNDLPQRWNQSDHFIIAELGFGTGLNFLETARQWSMDWQQSATLRFISYELYPLNTEELRRANSRWDNLQPLAEHLCQNWLTDHPRLQLKFPCNIHLDLFFGDANTLLPNRNLNVDAWYLDGFSPSKNPELWNEILMGEVYNSTKSGGTFATYSVAGYVRRNLQSAGFAINRAKGFGTKREMLKGQK